MFQELAKHGIDETDQKILTLLTRDRKMSHQKIADEIGISRQAIDRRIAKGAFQVVLNRMDEKTEEILARGQRKAALKLIKLLDSDNQKISLEAAKILTNPLLVKKIELANTVTHEIIHRSRIGAEGQLIQEVIEIDAEETTEEDLPKSDFKV